MWKIPRGPKYWTLSSLLRRTHVLMERPDFFLSSITTRGFFVFCPKPHYPLSHFGLRWICYSYLILSLCLATRAIVVTRNRLNLRNSVILQSSEKIGGQSRDEWLNFLVADPAVCLESKRVTRILELYPLLRTTYSDRTLMVFEFFLKFLDVLARAIKLGFHIRLLRYDGTKTTSIKYLILA